MNVLCFICGLLEEHDKEFKKMTRPSDLSELFYVLVRFISNLINVYRIFNCDAYCFTGRNEPSNMDGNFATKAMSSVILNMHTFSFKLLV